MLQGHKLQHGVRTQSRTNLLTGERAHLAQQRFLPLQDPYSMERYGASAAKLAVVLHGMRISIMFVLSHARVFFFPSLFWSFPLPLLLYIFETPLLPSLHTNKLLAKTIQEL